MRTRSLTKRWSLCIAAIPWIPIAIYARIPASEDPKAAKIDYRRQVFPILKAHCFSCHGPDVQRAGLNFSTTAGLRKGGIHGPVLKPGYSANSTMVERILGMGGKQRMPVGFGPLSSTDVKTIRLWIDQGAKIAGGPNFGSDILPIFKAKCSPCHTGSTAPGTLNLTSPQSIKKSGAVVPGKSRDSELIRLITSTNSKERMPLNQTSLSGDEIAKIRAWIDSGANYDMGAKAHWAFVAPVQPRIPHVKRAGWARNAIDFFVENRLEKENLKPSPEASKEILIRRVTLDLTGLPPTLPEIDAFLKDKSPTAYEKVVDRLLASPHYGERQARPWLDLARYADTNGYEKDARRTIWPYRDWVIQAYNENLPFDKFTIAQIAGDMLPGATVADRVATGFNRNTMLNEEGGVDQGEQRWLTLVDRVGTTAETWLGASLQCAQCHDHKFDPFTQKDFYQFLAFFESSDEPELDMAPPEVQAQRKQLNAEIAAKQALQKSLKGDIAKGSQSQVDELAKKRDALPTKTSLVLQEKVGVAPTTFIRIKGSYLAKSDQVSAGTPGFLPKLKSGGPVNRLSLARWLVSKDNPLTARVTVNRMWEQYFGLGIVETSDNFGTQGSPPTHPELLDWLACEFMRRNWDVKAVHRLIVTSATYRQSSDLTPVLLARDPQNTYLARGPRFRMEAEMIRDTTLATAGLLNLEIGGPSVFPLQPNGIWDSPYNDDKWNTSGGGQQYRRGIYTFWKRTAPYPEFVAFDATSREQCTLRRIRTNTPLQALTLLNDDAAMEAARALARRMMELHDGGSRVRYGFRLCTGRRPTQLEADRLLTLVGQLDRRFTLSPTSAAKLAKDPETAAFVMVANVLLNLDEAITKD